MKTRVKVVRAADPEKLEQEVNQFLGSFDTTTTSFSSITFFQGGISASSGSVPPSITYYEAWIVYTGDAV